MWEARPLAQSELGGGRLLSFPLSSLGKGRGLQLGLGILVGHPYGARPPWPASSSPSFIYVGKGAPQITTNNLLAVCGAPSIV